jgi:hypothetical protein
MGSLGGDGESRTLGACARRRSGPVCRTDRHLVSEAEESGGIEPLTRGSPWFSRPVPHREGRSPTAAGRRGIEPRWPVLETSPIPDRHPHPVEVTVRFRSGAFAFTARRAEPLHHGHSRGGGTRTLVARLSGACSALELRLCGDRALDCRRAIELGQGGWICPSGLRLPKPALIYPSSTLRSGRPARQAVHRLRAVRDRTRSEDAGAPMVPSSGIEPASPALQAGAISRSATRASSWPGWCPATGIVDYSVVRERFRRATNSIGDEDSNLDKQGQSLLACR